jgi:hypothetical protein
MEKTNVTAKQVLFISVGTTAVGPKIGKTRDDYTELQRKITVFNKLADGRAAAELPALRAGAIFAEVVEAHTDILGLAPEEVLSRLGNLSAEMTSTGFLAAHPQAGFGGGLDPARVRIVLLASDTAAGLFCAQVNASLLHQFLVRPACKCGAHFDNFTNGPACPAVRVRVVPGMEARRLDTIYPHLQQLCQTEAEGCVRVMFNITGGYKGAVPAITWLAGRFGTKAELFYQHESALAATRIAFIERGGGDALEMEEKIEVPKSIWPDYR